MTKGEWLLRKQANQEGFQGHALEPALLLRIGLLLKDQALKKRREKQLPKSPSEDPTNE